MARVSPWKFLTYLPRESLAAEIPDFSLIFLTYSWKFLTYLPRESLAVEIIDLFSSRRESCAVDPDLSIKCSSAVDPDLIIICSANNCLDIGTRHMYIHVVCTSF